MKDISEKDYSKLTSKQLDKITSEEEDMMTEKQKEEYGKRVIYHMYNDLSKNALFQKHIMKK